MEEGELKMSKKVRALRMEKEAMNETVRGFEKKNEPHQKQVDGRGGGVCV